MPKRSYDEYKHHFDYLVTTGIRLVLFLDSRSTWTFDDRVIVYRVSLEDTWVGAHIADTSSLPAIRDSIDTLEYMKIINSKTEWLYRASQHNPFKTDWFAWIDFGLVHVFSNPSHTLALLSELQAPETPGARTAGIWTISEAILDRINWRFAGGFLLIHASNIEELHTRVICKLYEIHPRFAWEVNIWALVEQDGFDFGWYPCDHNDSIIANI